MKQIYTLVLMIAPFLLTGCLDDPVMNTRLQNAKAPTVSETSLEGEISASAFTLKARILQENGLPVKECGVCWSRSAQAAPRDNMRGGQYAKADRMEESHTFITTLSGLEDSTRYYVYAYAINEVDTAFSETQKNYTTIIGIGEVTTLPVVSTEIHATTALVAGEIKNRGVGIDEMGFYYRKKTAGEARPELTAQDSVVLYKGDPAATDTFSCRITGLQPETWYYVRAFAKNRFGEFAFDVDSFRTTDGKPRLADLRLIADSTSFRTADLSALLVQQGDTLVTAYGFCWDETGMPTLETDADTIICNNLTAEGCFSGRIRNLKPAQNYFARAYAVNSYGISYSTDQVMITTKSDIPNIITFALAPDSIKADGTVCIGGELQYEGDSKAVEWGICWSATRREPTLENSEHWEATDTLFICTLDSLKGATTYYIRAYARNANNQIGYGTVQTLKTPDIFTEQPVYEGANRQYSAAFTHQHNIYVIGGDLGDTRSKEMFRFSSENDTWQTMSELPHALSNMSTAVNNDKAYVLGGIDNREVCVKSQQYNVTMNLWSELLDLPAQRFGSVSFIYRDSLYVLGGADQQLANQNGLFRYDLSNPDSAWMTLETEGFPAQRGGVAFEIGDDKIYAGLGDDGNGNCNALYVSSDSLTYWSELKEVPDDMKPVSSGIYDENRQSFIVIDNSGRIWESAFNENEWHKRSSVKQNYVNYHLFRLDDVIYILCQSLSKENKFMIYNPVWDN